MRVLMFVIGPLISVGVAGAAPVIEAAAGVGARSIDRDGTDASTVAGGATLALGVGSDHLGLRPVARCDRGDHVSWDQLEER